MKNGLLFLIVLDERSKTQPRSRPETIRYARSEVPKFGVGGISNIELPGPISFSGNQFLTRGLLQVIAGTPSYTSVGRSSDLANRSIFYIKNGDLLQKKFFGPNSLK